MAKFWRGGSGNWSDTAHWSLTSGGAGGAAVPTNADDVTFDANSGAPGAYTITMDVGANCRDLLFSAAPSGGGTVTWAGAQAISVFGSLLLLAGMVRTFTGGITFAATAAGKTINTSGVALASALTFSGAGGGWTFAAAINTTGAILHTAGACDYAGFAITAASFTMNQAAATVTLGAALVTLTGAWAATLGTLSAALSTIVLAGNFTGGGFAYGTVTATAAAANTFQGANTFVNLALLNTAVRTASWTVNANQTITGTLKCLGNSVLNRLLIQSSLPGTPRTITAAAIDAASNFCDFMDIAGAGAAAPFAIGASVGDCLGNSGITFTPSSTQTGTGTANLTFSTHAWAGAPARVPLPQDDVLIPNAFIAGRIITIDTLRACRSLTCTCTGNPQLTSSIGLATLYGSLTLAAGMTTSFIASGGVQLSARSAITVRCNGVTIVGTNLFLIAPNATITQLDALTASGLISQGAVGAPAASPTWDTGGFPLTCGGWIFRGNVVLGASLVTITGSGGNAWNRVSGNVTPGTSTIKFTDATATSKIFAGGGQTYYNVWFSGVGTGVYQITGSNTFNQLKADANRILQFTAATNNSAADFTIATGCSIGSITAASHTLTKIGGGRVLVDHATISRSNALPAIATFKAVYSTDGGNNTGWDFAVASALFSWPMMFIGTGEPPDWVNTDAGNAIGAVGPGGAGVTAWSDNPALCLRDFLVNRAGLAVDENYAADAAAWCDQLITGEAGTEKRCTMTLALTEKRPVRDWIETLRAYVPAWVVDAGGVWRIVADKPRAVDHYFGAGAIDANPAPQLTRTGTRDTPNSVDVEYTDVTKDPWQSYTATAELAGVTEVRRSSVALPGIRRFSQAKRFAIERLNHYTLEDTVGRMSIFDYGLRVLPGDIAQVSESAFGWAGRAVRILGVSDKGNGRWEVEFREYDPGAYSTEVQTASGIPDTALSSPLSVLAPTNVNAVEVLSAESNMASVGIGTGIIFQSRVRLTFDESLDPYLDHYDVLIYNNPANPIVDRVERGVLRWLSPTLQQLTTYNIEIRAVNTLGITSPLVSRTLFIDGKLLPPGDVPAITQAFEVGGEVLLTWQPALDFDTLRYEWRVDLGNTGKVWDAMLLVDSVDGLRARFRGMPEGTHRFCVKALDSVGNYSVNARCALITVTSDASAFVQDVVFVAPTLTRMVQLLTPFKMDENATLRPRWVTSDPATSWDVSLPSPVDAGVLPMRAYGADASICTWRGEVQDIGVAVGGDFTIAARLTSYTGSVRSWIEHSTDNVTWNSEEVTGGLSWRGEARFLRARFDANAAGDSFLVEGYPRISISASEAGESGGPVLSSASLPTTITLTGHFSKATLISITPSSALSRTPTIDAVIVGAGVPNKFNVYLFDAAGAQVADYFYWTFKGV